MKCPLAAQVALLELQALSDKQRKARHTFQTQGLHAQRAALAAQKEELLLAQTSLTTRGHALEEEAASLGRNNSELLARINAKQAQQDAGEGLTSWDLVALGKEIAALRAQIDKAADVELEKLAELEELAEQIQAKQQELAQNEQATAEVDTQLAAQAAQLEAQLAELAAQSEALRAQIPAEVLAEYDYLCSRSGGLGIRAVTAAELSTLPLADQAALTAGGQDELYLSEDSGCFLVQQP